MIFDMLQWGMIAVGDIFIARVGIEKAELLANEHVTYQGEELA